MYLQCPECGGLNTLRELSQAIVERVVESVDRERYITWKQIDIHKVVGEGSWHYECERCHSSFDGVDPDKWVVPASTEEPPYDEDA